MLWVPALACAAEAPEAVYAKFHRAVVAGDFNEMIKYGTAKQAAETRAMPPAARQAALELVRRLMPKTYSLAGKRIETDERMTLRLVSQGAGGISSGTARMQMENGEWKVDEVNWGGGTAARTASAAPPAAARRGGSTAPRSPSRKLRCAMASSSCGRARNSSPSADSPCSCFSMVRPTA
jgi:hypothetical protein